MLIKEYVNTPAKRVGLISIVLSGMLFLTIAFIWNIKNELFIYREEIQPVAISVRIEPVLKDEQNQPVQKNADVSNQGLFHVNKDAMEPYGYFYLDRKCYYAMAPTGSWIDMSKDQQEKLARECNPQKFGRQYEWKTSFGDFFHSLTKIGLFYVSIFFFIGGVFLIAGIPQRLAVWIQKGK